MRARNIKPSFFKNEHLAALSPHARLLFAGLWCLADCNGRLEDRPLRIKGELLPYEDVEADSLLRELASSPERFIIRYEVAGGRYIEIRNFTKHQNPHKKEREAGSKIPPCPELVQEKPGNSRAGSGLEWIQSGTIPGPDRIQIGSSPADSLNLIPDSLTRDPGVRVNDAAEGENRKLAQEGMAYLSSLNSPNHCNISWITGYLSIKFRELAEKRPDMPKAEILAIWRDTCDAAVASNATPPNWFKKVFERKVDAWTPAHQKTHVPASASSQQRDALMAFPYVKHKLTGETIKTADLEARPEAPGSLFCGGNSYPVAMLEGLGELE